jgi:hypothetical protein
MDRLEHPTVIAGTLKVDQSVYGQFTVNVGGSSSLVLEMGSVGDAKQQIVRKTGMPTHMLHVWHAGKELLDDSAHVMSYGVEDGSHLQLLLLLNGGGLLDNFMAQVLEKFPVAVDRLGFLGSFNTKEYAQKQATLARFGFTDVDHQDAIIGGIEQQRSANEGKQQGTSPLFVLSCVPLVVICWYVRILSVLFGFATNHSLTLFVSFPSEQGRQEIWIGGFYGPPAYRTNEQLSAFTQYSKTATRLLDAAASSPKSIVAVMLETLAGASAIVKDEAVSRFYMVDGPSGSGKTQLAITLAQGLRGRRVPAVWLLSSKTNGKSQNIYQSSSDMTSALVEATAQDLRQGVWGDDGMAVSNFSTRCLYLFDFICTLAETVCATDGTPVDIYGELFVAVKKPLEKISYHDALDRLKALEMSPVFFLDEFPRLVADTSSNDNISSLRLMRNCFRSLKLVVVLLGTDARITNMTLVDKQAQSRNRKETDVWCSVLLKFPDYVPAISVTESQTESKVVSDAVKIWSQASNAWIKQIGLSYLETLSSETETGIALLGAAAVVRKEWEATKPKFLSDFDYSRLGQVMLVAGSPFESKEGTSQGGDLVSHHMATATACHKTQFDLVSVEGALLVDIFNTERGYQVKVQETEDGNEAGEQKETMLMKDLVWVKRFPDASNDPTVFLSSIAGGKYMLREEKRNVNNVNMLELCQCVYDETSSLVWNDQSVAEARDGDRFEFLFSCAWVAATVGPHSHGMWTKPSTDVLRNLLLQLTVINNKTQQFSLDLSHGDIKELFPFEIPVCAPVQHDMLKEFSMKTSSIKRAKNKDKTDCKIFVDNKLVMVAECKNHAGKVGKKIVLESVTKGHGTKVRFIVCRELANLKKTSLDAASNKGICVWVASASEEKSAWILTCLNPEWRSSQSDDFKINAIVLPVVTLCKQVNTPAPRW